MIAAEMHERFLQYCDHLQAKLDALVAMEGLLASVPPPEIPKRGVYLLTENHVHVYSGRSNRMRERIREHCRGNHRKAALAFKLARIETGNVTPTYRTDGSRADLMARPEFAGAFRDAQIRISNMTLRFVEETDPVRQCLLEIYVSFVLETTHNSWDTT